MRALQMFFRILKSKGFTSPEAYRVARFAIQNHVTLYIAAYSLGFNPDVFDIRTPAGRI